MPPKSLKTLTCKRNAQTNNATHEESDNEDQPKDTNRKAGTTNGAIAMPVRSKKCNHTYDKSSMEQLIRSNGGWDVKCPVIGCNQKIEPNDLVPLSDEKYEELKKLIDETKQYCDETIRDNSITIQQRMNDIVKKRHADHQTKIETLHRYIYGLTAAIILVAIVCLSLPMFKKTDSHVAQVHYNDTIKLMHISDSCTLNYPRDYTKSYSNLHPAVCNYYRNDYDYWRVLAPENGPKTGPVYLGDTIELQHVQSKKIMHNDNGERIICSKLDDTSSNFRIVAPDMRSGVVETGTAIVLVHKTTNRKLYKEEQYGVRDDEKAVIASYKSDLRALWKIIEIKDRYYKE
jgi:hypothetical protein